MRSNDKNKRTINNGGISDSRQQQRRRRQPNSTTSNASNDAILDNSPPLLSSSTMATSNKKCKRESSSGDGNIRQRLQRGAKDKVYAERLAAEVVGISTANKADTNVASGGSEYSSRRHSSTNNNNSGDEGGDRKGGASNNNEDNVLVNHHHHHPRQEQSTATTTSRSNNRRSSNSKGSKQSSAAQQQQPFQMQRDKSSKKQPPKERVTRIKTPPGWPFTNPNNTTTTTSSLNSGKKRGRKRKSSVTTAATATTTGNDGGNDNGNLKMTASSNPDGHVSTATLPPSSSLSSSSTSTTTELLATHQKRQRRRQTQRSVVVGETSSPLPPILEKTASKQQQKKKKEHRTSSGGTPSITSSSKSNDTTSSSRRSNNKNSSTNKQVNTNNKWTCVRCTLLNTLRRKKCQVCGTPRCYTNNDDNGVKVDDDISSSSLVDTVVAAAAGNDSNELRVAANRSAENNDDGRKMAATEKGTLEDDDDTNASLTLEHSLSVSPSRSIPATTNDSKDYDDDINSNNHDDSLEYTTVHVSLTVSNARVYDAAASTTTTVGNGETINMTNINTGLSAIVPASIFCRREEQSDDVNCDGNPVATEEANNVALEEEGAPARGPTKEEEEECGLQQQESQSQTSIQSELSAMIDASPTSSSSLSAPTNPPDSIQDGTLLKETSAANHEESQEEMIQQQSLSQLSVQSELSAMIDATSLQQKLPGRQQQQQELPNPRQDQQEQEQAQQSESGHSTEHFDQIYANDDAVQVPSQQGGQQAQSPSDFKQWLQKRKNSRREKKRRRKRSKSTVNDSEGQRCIASDGSDGGNDDFGTSLKFTTVVVRLTVPDRECDDAKATATTTTIEDDAASLQNVLSAILPISIFSQKDEKFLGINNVDAVEEVVDAANENIDDAGDCNHPCNEENDVMQQQSALLCEDFIDSAHEDMGGDEQSNFHVKESVDIELDASNSADTHHQVGILPDPNEGNTPICKTNEKCPSTQGSSSVNSHFSMTQQLPDFDYFTQASIESPVIQRGEKSSRDSQDQNQDESKSQRDVEHDATSYNSNSAKDSSNEHIEVKEQTLPTINSNHDISEETLDKENVSTHSQADNSEIGDIVRQPLQNIKTIQNDADNADSNIYQFTESNEIETLTLGFGSSVAGSGKAIA
eukprot:scaffold19056_cov90-Skeletonema_dohrnii-CCMP3373.AAC.1